MAESPQIKFNLSEGINSNPFKGNAHSFCVDNTTVRGVGRINYKTVQRQPASGSFSPAVQFIDGVMLGEDGDLWSYNEGNDEFDLIVDTARNSADFCIWKDYYIIVRGSSTRLDAVSTGGTETNITSSLEGGDVVITGSDNIVYFARNNIVGTLSEVSGQTFNPATPATFSLNTEALDLPSNEVIKAMVELGAFILIGCESGRLYLWDRTSSTFELPTKVPRPVRILIPTVNLVYVVLNNGDIYVTNGSSVNLVNEFPKHILGEPDKYIFNPRHNAYRVIDQKMYFGLGEFINGISPSGVYSYDIADRQFSFDFICSNGKTGDTVDNKISVTAMQNIGSNFFIGFEDADGPIIDEVPGYAVGGTDRYTNYTAFVVSPMYVLGDEFRQVTLKHHTINFAKKLPGDCSARLSYRTTINGTWKTIGTVTGGNVEQKTFTKSIQDLTKVQFLLEMNTSSSQTPEIINVVSTTV